MSNNTFPNPFITESLVLQWAANASNVKTGTNPAYTSVEFLADFPDFTGTITAGMLDAFIELAHTTVVQARWKTAWRLGMGYFIAHYATQYINTQTGSNPGASGQAKGVIASESVGDVSVSYDTSSVSGDFSGWGDYKITKYGQQFMTLAKPLGLAGMYIW